MVTLTVDQLRTICPRLRLEQAQFWVPALNAAAAQFDINATGDRFAAWLAQCAQESDAFTAARESTYYTTVERIRKVFARTHRFTDAQIKPYVKNSIGLANWIYAGMLGNGNEASGDGYAYRGGGIIGVTGRANFRDTARLIAQPLEQQPVLIERPDVSALAAAAWWHTHKLNDKADALEGDAETKAITLVVNGGYNGLANRIEFARRAHVAFGLKS